MPPSCAPIHGNYHGYYTKRPFSSDARLAALPDDLFAGARVLDVGCNEGWVTCEIAQSHGANFVVGVDIDAALVQAAWRRRISVWSTQAPTGKSEGGDEGGEEPGSSPPAKKRRRELDVSVAPRASYFPASCEHELGPLPIPPAAHRGKTTFPHNVAFRAADWPATSIPEDAAGYDVVVGLSISKWIHLNDGDAGLRRFFARVFAVLRAGGAFVLEPQPWESYAKARRMDEKLKNNAKSLTIRPADFEALLTDIGFRPARHFGFVGEGGFSRPIDVYTKP
ncbi:hypothetical protein HYPSUDRAFT_69643 [Hypholoma sublateritium FD-334 SS-4]|uniref:RNA methyltransferase n=1 Tax=Hypholoma sublateritium (strain FD-334 SS-4) TaxID=945553 RepID=A0A0D2PEX0_HYPSF|nr:hypothetical protein HYPSUDRAFT_69643 [Hypholoma sublateritium FD-334 SS-4]